MKTHGRMPNSASIQPHKVTIISLVSEHNEAFRHKAPLYTSRIQWKPAFDRAFHSGFALKYDKLNSMHLINKAASSCSFHTGIHAARSTDEAEKGPASTRHLGLCSQVLLIPAI